MYITDEEKLALQGRYEPFDIMMDLTDAQEALDGGKRRAQRAALHELLATMSPRQWKLFQEYMGETFEQMLMVEAASFYEGINQAVEYINKNTP